eukprot:CAMPEP_0204213824 /NCGR_PEP_ID=MMETSP0361-20130328/76284_1 /ASSEMBLY_ACC=CAM_ASM_000343 /TAXON_ID=268821 /ORGANISM="Scrippsiella Hangoei, Strain SHTV-5" /LENGTH=103 /DNA_ID=CAMNT_0051178351 /DNA_START=68 /DNA_END=375 /DNA_ORIENTATION=-
MTPTPTSPEKGSIKTRPSRELVRKHPTSAVGQAQVALLAAGLSDLGDSEDLPGMQRLACLRTLNICLLSDAYCASLRVCDLEEQLKLFGDSSHKGLRTFSRLG